MNIKKIGLSALAGSLAVVSANAVELTVTGKTEVTYVSNEGSTGNPFGMGNSIGFTGTGDVNGMIESQNARDPSGLSITGCMSIIANIKGIVIGNTNCWVSASASTAEPTAAKSELYMR